MMDLLVFILAAFTLALVTERARPVVCPHCGKLLE